ncbi:MAG: RNA polymerase sigma-70 factor [Bacteroidales bacterium]|jgi:RNA polymerase sigma-70 factor (ECF subfamily)|nr:RNA polymerase sigma-70 factor [Bacteroidales bacterium]
MSIKNNISDYELVEKLNSGDLVAFDQIFHLYSKRLYGFAFKYLKNKEESEELIQDVFLIIWETRKSIKKDESFKNYLFTITYHNIVHVFRRKQIGLKIIQRIEKNNVQLSNIEERLDYKIALNKVESLIEELPEKYRTIFIKNRKEGKSAREIAKEMNLTPGTVDNIICKNSKYIKNKLLAWGHAY